MHRLWWIAAIAPALALVALSWSLQVDAPLPDDVDAILRFANQSVVAPHTLDRVALWFEPHVDHRILPTRAAAALQLAWYGHVDLRGLAALGVGALLLVGLLLPRLRADSGDVPLALAPIAWLLFQPQAYDTLISPTMGANLQVLPLAVGTLLALRRGTVASFAAAGVLAAIAAFTQGNGVLVLPAALLALFLAGRPRSGAAWLGVAVVVALAYLAGDTTSRATPFSGLGDPLGILLYGLAFLGSAAGFGHGGVSVAVGVALLVFFGANAANGAPRRNPWLWGAVAFVMLSIAANASGRSGMGVEYAVAQPRYRVYSALALALGHLVALERVGARRPTRYAAIALAASMAFGAASYLVAAPRAFVLASGAARGLARWSVTGEWPTHPRPERARADLARSRELGTFGVDLEGLSRHLDRSVERALPPHSELVRGVVTRSEAGDAFRLVEGRFDPAGLDVATLRVFLVLDGDQIVTARTHAVRGGRLAGLTRGFRTLVPLDLVPEAPRQVGLLLSDAVNETYTDRIAIPGHAGTPECERCNVVLVTFDALRADHLGSIRASAHGMTPHLDAFGRESVVFTRALAQSASTVVSLPSLFTSKFPYLDDAYAPLGLRPGQRTLTHTLADAGYSTAAVVGWRYAGSLTRLDAGFEVFEEVAEEIESAAETLEKATAVIEGLAEPFFLWVHLRPPHRPYRVEENSFRAFYNHPREPGPTLHSHPLDPVRAHIGDRERFTPYNYFGRRRPEALSPSMVRQVRALYAASVREADADFGAWLRGLEARGLPDRSVIAIAADHGEVLGEHHLFGHNRLLYEALHTPIVVRVPGRAPAVEARPVMNVDLYPTLLNRVGVPFHGPIRGHDLLGPPRADPYQLAEYEHWRSLIVGDLQVILKPSGPQLYPVPGPGEATAPLPGSGTRLVERARSLRPLGGDRAKPLADDSATFEALRSLGYIE